MSNLFEINFNKFPKRLVVIGNSHVHQFSGEDPRCIQFQNDSSIVYRLGPATAYKFCDKYLNRIKEILKSIEFCVDEDLLITVAGEIDCRIHILEQSQIQERKVESIITHTALKYFQTHILLSNIYPELKCIIWGIHPSRPNSSHRVEEDYFGTVDDRNNVTKLFNKELNLLCNATKNIKFASIYSHILDNNGDVNEDLYLDSVHLDANKIKNFLELELNNTIKLFNK